MIGIQTYDTAGIAKFLGAAGLGSAQVTFNPNHFNECSVIVHVGGPGVRSNHCYIQLAENTPVIQCLDPKTINKEPINLVFILCALEKARRISEHGVNIRRPEIQIPETTTEIAEFIGSYSDSIKAINGPLSIDIECDPETCELTCFGMAYHKNEVTYAMSVPLSREGLSYWSELDEANVWERIAQLCGTSTDKLFQNYIFDTMILSKWGVEVNGRIFDTMTAAHLLQPELPKGLENLARLYIDCEPWKGIGSYVSNETLWRYNARDAAYTLDIFYRLQDLLMKSKQWDFFENHLTPLSTEILRMCERGWTVNLDALRRMKDEIQPEIDYLLSCLRTFATPLLPAKTTYILRRGRPNPGVVYARGLGQPTRYQTKPESPQVIKAAYNSYEDISLPPNLGWLRDLGFPVFERMDERREFNPSSPSQVAAIIRALGYKIPTQRGEETTNELALKKLQSKTKDPFFDEILRYRSATKMMSTYCNVRLDDDGRIRFSVNICGTVGGRFSSKGTPWGTGFNAQNIPKRFRHISIPHEPNWIIVNLDFAQADPHLVAWLAGDTTMLEILSDPDGDLHAHTAQGIYGREVSEKERKLGKICNNGLNYGMGLHKFIETCRQQNVILQYSEASEIYEKYFTLYPGISEWQKQITQQINKTRRLATPFGRRRKFFGHHTPRLIQEALAYIPPTTVADALNAGWLNFVALKADLRVHVLQQCHDSLKLECHEDDLDDVCETLQRAYKAVIFRLNEHNCNLPIELEYGPNWGTLIPWKKPS
jgi:DNA polymerase I-like protein with 3'-5' exonuclease and polymerase domains